MIVDAGPLVAYVDDRDAAHDACLRLLAGHVGPLVVPSMVIAEAAYLIERRAGPLAEVAFLADIRTGELSVEPVHPGDWDRIAELVETYRDLPLGTVDASAIAAAERLGITRIATLDRRHFSVVRPRHAEAFTLLS